MALWLETLKEGVVNSILLVFLKGHYFERAFPDHSPTTPLCAPDPGTLFVSQFVIIHLCF